MKWLAVIVCAILAALLLKQCTQPKEAAPAPPVPAAPKAPEAPKVVEAPKPALPSFGKWTANVADGKVTLEGAVKDQAAKDAILAAAKATYGDSNVVDKLTLDAALPTFSFAGKWAEIFGWLKSFGGKTTALVFDGSSVKGTGEMGEAVMKDADAKIKSMFGDGVTWSSELKGVAMAAADAFKAGAKTFKLDVEFDTGSAKIGGGDAKELNDLAELIKDGKTKGEIGGHTDNVGPPERNLALSQRRADSVVAYLVGKGVPKDALSGKGYGDTKPLADNATDEGKQKNRRVEFVAQ